MYLSNFTSLPDPFIFECTEEISEKMDLILFRINITINGVIGCNTFVHKCIPVKCKCAIPDFQEKIDF